MAQLLSKSLHVSIKIHGDSRKDKIDYTAYAPDAKDLQNFYGLPKHIAFCTKCGISNQRPNSSIGYWHKKLSVKKTVAFDEAGICDALKIGEQ